MDFGNLTKVLAFAYNFTKSQKLLSSRFGFESNRLTSKFMLKDSIFKQSSAFRKTYLFPTVTDNDRSPSYADPEPQLTFKIGYFEKLICLFGYDN